MLLSEGFGWYTFQPPSSAVSTTLVGQYYSGVYNVRVWEDGAVRPLLPDYLITGALANNSGNSYMSHR